MKIHNIRKYLDLKPVEKITIMKGNGKDVDIKVFSCLSYVHGYKLLEKDLFNEIEENSFDKNYNKYSERYFKDLDDSITNIPNISLKTIKWWFDSFEIEFKEFESLYTLLENDLAIELFQDWIESNEIDKPSGSNIKIQENIYHFTKRESVKRIKEQISKFLPERKNKNKLKKFEEYFLNKSLDKIQFLKEIFNQNESPKEYAMMICLLTQNDVITIKTQGRADFYRAWYDYIEKQYPINDNFAAINDYIEPGKNGDFIFKIKDDGDYERMKKSFKEKFNLN